MGYLPYQLVNRISEPSTVSITEWFSPYYPATWKLHPMGHVILRHRRLGPSHSGRGRWGIAWVFLDDRNPFPLSSPKKTWDFSFSWDSGNPANIIYICTHHIYPADIFGRPLCLSPTSWSSSCPRIPISRSSSVRVRNRAGWKIVGFFLWPNLPFQNDHHFCSQKGTPSFFKIPFLLGGTVLRF